MADLERSPVTIVGTKLPRHIKLPELLDALDRLAPLFNQTVFKPKIVMRPALIRAIDALSRAMTWLPKPAGYDHRNEALSPVRDLLKICVAVRCAISGQIVPPMNDPASVPAEFRDLYQQVIHVFGPPANAVAASCGETSDPPKVTTKETIDFGTVRQFAESSLKFKQQRLVLLLVDRSGAVPLSDLAADSQINWPNRSRDNCFESLRKKVNAKLSGIDPSWEIVRRNNSAILRRLEAQ